MHRTACSIAALGSPRRRIGARRAGRRQGPGQGGVHRAAHRRRLGEWPGRAQCRRSRGQAAQCRCGRQVRVRDDRARRRVQTEHRRPGGDQGRRRQRRRRRGHPLLLGGRDRHRRHLSQVRPAGDRLGRGPARHHLRQRLPGDPPRQRHHDQPERHGRRFHDRPRLQDLGGHPRHHRLRQRPQQVLQPVRRPRTAARSWGPSASPPSSRTSPRS